MASPLVNVHKTVGGLLIGSWANSILMIMEIHQVMTYFRQHHNDRLVVRAAVISALFIDIWGTIASYATVYLYGIVNWGDIAYLQTEPLPIGICVITTGLTSAVVQSFMIHRYWRSGRNHWVAAPLTAIMLTGLAGAFATGVTTMIAPGSIRQNITTTYVTMWLSASAMVDFSIAFVLVLQLRKVKSSSDETKSLIRRLIGSTIKTGVATFIVAIFGLFAYLHEPGSNVALAVAFILGGVYTNTMLYNLTTARSWSVNVKCDDDDLAHFGGIQVCRSAIITYDEGTTFVLGLSDADVSPYPTGDFLCPPSPTSPTDSSFSGHRSHAEKDIGKDLLCPPSPTSPTHTGFNLHPADDKQASRPLYPPSSTNGTAINFSAVPSGSNQEVVTISLSSAYKSYSVHRLDDNGVKGS